MSLPISRREFALLMSAGVVHARAQEKPEPEISSRVALVKAKDPRAALESAVGQFGRPDFAGRDVYLKASYGSSGPYPATTHPDSLAAVVDILRRCNCGGITLVERCGMGETRQVWDRLGVDALARRMQVTLLALDELAEPDQWRIAEMPGSHWPNGVALPRFLDQDALVVQICNAKTHRFGGVFSASLKNSVGLIAKYARGLPARNYMQELHESPYQCQMIAEINQLYKPALVFMDAAQVMISGGPETGDLADAGIFAVSNDRVATDAVALALLRIYGADQPIRRTDIFEHEQIKRAVELKLGAGSPEKIELMAEDSESRNTALQIRAVMRGISEDN